MQIRYISRLGGTALLSAAVLVLATFRAQDPSVVTMPKAPIRSRSDRIVYPANHNPSFVLSTGELWHIRSILNTRRKMRFGDFLWNDAGVPAGPTFVRIDLSKQTLSIFRAGHEVGFTVILFGTDGKPTPLGVFPIIAKAKEHRSSLYDAEMPYMMRLTHDGVALHASNVREGSATHGCIGVPLNFAELLYSQVKLGDRVLVVRS
uniref:L,D-transpeptidase family protein n=1 Tax=uncultured Sphingomonas sp. TaxID=158754 RepID=UPI0035CC935F